MSRNVSEITWGGLKKIAFLKTIVRKELWVKVIITHNYDFGSTVYNV
jgi:hypothetical protein